MVATLSWPADLPCPQLRSWSGTGYSALMRFKADGGNTLQRRRSIKMLHGWQATWFMTQAEYERAMPWFNEHAAEPFLITAGSIAGYAVPHSMRLMSTLKSTPVMTERGLYWEVQALLQWDPSDDNVNMWPDLGNWIIANNPAAPSAPDWYVAGTPVAPSNTDLVIAGTPALPNANV